MNTVVAEERPEAIPRIVTSGRTINVAEERPEVVPRSTTKDKSEVEKIARSEIHYLPPERYSNAREAKVETLRDIERELKDEQLIQRTFLKKIYIDYIIKKYSR